MDIIKKGISIKTFLKRPLNFGHILTCYIGIYTILQLQLVCGRHHDLGNYLDDANHFS